jgi:TPR repeat protein
MDLSSTRIPYCSAAYETSDVQWAAHTAVQFYKVFGNPIRTDQYRSSAKVSELWDKVVQRDDPKAMVVLGAIYTTGCPGVERNFGLAASLLTKAADLNDEDALIYQLWIAFAANGNTKALAGAEDRIRKAAEKGIPGALCALGVFLRFNDSFPRDHSSSLTTLTPAEEEQQIRKFIAKAAELGNLHAMVFHAGIGRLERKEKIQLCTQAVEKGCARGYFLLAELLFASDRAKAIEYLELGVKAEDLGSIGMLADIYRFDNSTFDKAIELLQKCADQGDLSSMVQIAWIFERQEKTAQALIWFKRAVKECGPGYKKVSDDGAFFRDACMLKIANIYSWGIHDVPVDQKRASKWFRRAAEQGNAEAMTQLSQRFAAGNGLPTDFRESKRWSLLKEACRQ